jgi:hypothetical protein
MAAILKSASTRSLLRDVSSLGGSLQASVSLDPLRVLVGRLVDVVFDAPPDPVRAAYDSVLQRGTARKSEDAALPVLLTAEELLPHMPARGHGEIVRTISDMIGDNNISSGGSAEEQAARTIGVLAVARDLAERCRSSGADPSCNHHKVFVLFQRVRSIIARSHASDVSYLASTPFSAAQAAREFCSQGSLRGFYVTGLALEEKLAAVCPAVRSAFFERRANFTTEVQVRAPQGAGACQGSRTKCSRRRILAPALRLMSRFACNS